MSRYENLLLDNQLCFALYAATHAITRAYRARLGEFGLTYPQYLVLLVLWENDGQTVKGLAQKLNLDSGTLTPLLKRLESAGFIVRRRSLADERVVVVSLTPAGAGLQPAIADVQHHVACQTGLSPEELAALRDSLHNLTKTIMTEAEATA